MNASSLHGSNEQRSERASEGLYELVNDTSRWLHAIKMHCTNTAFLPSFLPSHANADLIHIQKIPLNDSAVSSNTK